MDSNNSNATNNQKGASAELYTNREFDSSETAATSLTRCEQCGHMLPTENMPLHRAACHASHHQHATGVGNNNGNNNPAAAAASTTTSPGETVRCATCGKHVSPLSAVAHEATCHRQVEHRPVNEHNSSGDDNANMMDPLEFQPPEAIEAQQQEQGDRTSRASHSSLVESNQQQQQQHEWSCPRCTLLNEPTELFCQACGYFSGHSSSSSSTSRGTTSGAAADGSASDPTTSPSTIRVQVRQMDPRYVTAVTTAASIMSWTALGALVAGPVGAAVGGVGAALASAGAVVGNHNNDNNNNGRHQFSFTSTRITPTGATTTRYVTGGSSNSGGDGVRTVIVQAPDGVFNGRGSVADRMILQMLILNAMNQGAPNIDQMTYDELLRRFGVGSEHRGASQETIEALPLTKLDQAAVETLSENQRTCNICLEDLKDGEEMRKLPDCSHVFHRQCIDEWLGRVASCPICKKEIQRANTTPATERAAMQSSVSHHPNS